MSLSTAQKKKLRSQAHPLKPYVTTGQAGVSETVLAEIEQALNHHELIKIKLRADRDTRQEMIEHIQQATGADIVQAIGQILTLYRENPDK